MIPNCTRFLIILIININYQINNFSKIINKYLTWLYHILHFQSTYQTFIILINLQNLFLAANTFLFWNMQINDLMGIHADLVYGLEHVFYFFADVYQLGLLFLFEDLLDFGDCVLLEYFLYQVCRVLLGFGFCRVGGDYFLWAWLFFYWVNLGKSFEFYIILLISSGL